MLSSEKKLNVECNSRENVNERIWINGIDSNEVHGAVNEQKEGTKRTKYETNKNAISHDKSNWVNVINRWSVLFWRESNTQWDSLLSKQIQSRFYVRVFLFGVSFRWKFIGLELGCRIQFDNYMSKWRFYYVCYVQRKFLLRFGGFPWFFRIFVHYLTFWHRFTGKMSY